MAKKYKCPYCNNRYERKALISHIDKKHEELIPDGYTSTRVVFDLVNKNPGYGICRVCSKHTNWNDKAGRYDVLCGDPKCKEKMREEYKKNMLRVKGTYNILDDPEQQKEMLAHRKISGVYKFSDGGEHIYTGSYEKKCLEFMDKFMQIPSKDIMAPGPTISYTHDARDSFYITDFYYIPYNLIIEVKDGGSNPNTKSSKGMDSSRQRTLEKERLITDRGEYNYVRLTNNNFAQLVEVFMDIKMKLLEGDTTPTVKINEDAIILEGFYANKPLYFYHLINKDVELDDNGILSLDYMYKHKMYDLYDKNADKYRGRLCNEWGIYPNKKPSELTRKEIYDGINEFRETNNGNKYIYFFRFPPYTGLDSYFRTLYKYKRIVRVDINSPTFRTHIREINYGYINSDSNNPELSRKYYKKIIPKDYFSQYNSDLPLRFASLPHIGIVTDTGTIPLAYLEEVAIPHTLSDIE